MKGALISHVYPSPSVSGFASSISSHDVDDVSMVHGTLRVQRLFHSQLFYDVPLSCHQTREARDFAAGYFLIAGQDR